MFVLLLGSGIFTIYHIMALEDQLDEATRAIDKMDGKVKWAQYEQTKFYSLAKDVLRLAPKDPNAEKVAADFKLRELQAAKPVLMDLKESPAVTNAAPVAPANATNSAPAQPSQATNAAPSHPPSPTTK